MDGTNPGLRRGVTCALLAAVTVAAYARVAGNDFILCDDPLYVTANPRVLDGLSWEGLVWAFGGTGAGNWHPLTWLSHMLDVELFGLAPAGHHLASLLFHLANTLLLFRWLEGLTGAPWRSATVAALFGVHPLHVESVAWISERKDLLSACFFLLTLLTYARYVRKADASRKPARWWPATGAGRGEYLLCLALFALGLMSKPMLVTLPAVLLLVDFWPLARLSQTGPGTAMRLEGPPTITEGAALGAATTWTPSRLAGLAAEKLPFFALALASCVVTYLVQYATHATTSVLPLSSRLANAAVSYVKYLAETAWPTRLAAFYPHPDTRYPISHQWPLWGVLAAALLLAGVSCIALRRLRRQPWLAVGWFWFLGTLVPVIGLVQVGGQAMADRYTYIPLIGVFIVVVWAAADLLDRNPAGRALLSIAALAAVAAATVVTQRQVRFWRDDLTLFQHALEVTADNAVAQFRVGTDLRLQGKLAEAIPHFEAAIAAAPALADGYYGLALAKEAQGRPREAAESFGRALSLAPWDARIHEDLGAFLWLMDRRQDAEAQFREALRLDPNFPVALANLGIALSARGNLPEATACFTAAARLTPGDAEVLARLAELLVKQARLPDAEAIYRECLRLSPTNVQTRVNLGGVLWREGRANDALAQYAEAVRLRPELPLAHLDLGAALSAQGHFADAAAEFNAALRLQPDNPEGFTGLGRALAGEGKFDQAQAPFRKATQLNPTNAELRVYLGSALMMAGQTNEAHEAFAAALRLEPALAQRTVLAGQSLAAQGQLSAAMARFSTALWLQPGNADAHQSLGLLLERQGRTNEALPHLREAARLRGGPGR